VLEEDAREIGLANTIHELGGRFAARRIQAHVERLALLKAEAAARLVELIRGHAEIEHDRACLLDAVRARHAREVAEVGLREHCALAEGGEPCA
jgi:hypothetical protein